MNGFYYLHRETKDLIWKKFDPGEDNSPFVEKVWSVGESDRGKAWQIVLEGLALGVKIERAKDLATKWNLTFKDSIEMLKRVKPSDLMRAGMEIFVERILGMNPEEYWQKVKKE